MIAFLKRRWMLLSCAAELCPVAPGARGAMTKGVRRRRRPMNKTVFKAWLVFVAFCACWSGIEVYRNDQAWRRHEEAKARERAELEAAIARWAAHKKRTEEKRLSLESPEEATKTKQNLETEKLEQVQLEEKK